MICPSVPFYCEKFHSVSISSLTYFAKKKKKSINESFKTRKWLPLALNGNDRKKRFNCKFLFKILTWHTQTKKNQPASNLDLKKYDGTNLVKLRDMIVWSPDKTEPVTKSKLIGSGLLYFSKTKRLYNWREEEKRKRSQSVPPRDDVGAIFL